VVCLATMAGSMHGKWHESSGVSRKRKRASLVDVDKIKDELKAEVTQDILSMLASQGIQLQPFSRGPSPTLGRRSSCASASVADIHPEADPDLVEPKILMHHVLMIL